MNFAEKILDLPMIVQGALGSGLFWLALEFIQRGFKKIAELRKKSDKHKRNATRVALGSLLDSNPDVNRLMFQLVVQGTLHNVVSALIFIATGLLIESAIPVFGVVGFVGALFYLFRARAFVPDFSRWKSDEEMKKIYEG